MTTSIQTLNGQTTNQETSQATDRLLCFDIDPEGKIVEHPLSKHEKRSLDNTLLVALYPDIKVAIVNIPLGFLDGRQEALVMQALKCFEFKGVVYHLVGGSSSSKDGRFYLVDKAHHELLGNRFYFSAQDAIVYFGTLVSPCKKLVSFPDARVLFVPDGMYGTNDCCGFVSEPCLANFLSTDIPDDRVYQIRLGFQRGPQSMAVARTQPQQAKGCVKAMSKEVADALGADIVLPMSSLKPELHIPQDLVELVKKEGRRFTGPVILGIREVSENRDFRSSYTLTIHAPKDSIEKEIEPAILEEVAKLNKAISENDNLALLDLLGMKELGQVTEETELRALHAVILADREGLIVQFPYVNNQLNKHLATWGSKAGIGGGLRLPGFILASDGFVFAHNGNIYSASDWIPGTHVMLKSDDESTRSLIVRYPIRNKYDLLPMLHMTETDVIERLTEVLKSQGCTDPVKVAEQIFTQQLALKGTCVLHSKTAKRFGGDYDGDYVCVVSDKRFPRFVQSRFAMAEVPATEKNKVRVRSPWSMLPLVAMQARGNQIGMITDTITSCLAAGRLAEANELGVELQAALDSLKWKVSPRKEVIDRINQQVPRAPWLAVKRIQTLSKLPERFDVPETDLIGQLYNRVRARIPDLGAYKGEIANFKLLVPGADFTDEMYKEARWINSVYASLTARATQRQDRLNEAYDRASAATDEARLESDPEARAALFELKRKAYRERQLGEARTAREYRCFHIWLALWANSKPQEQRMMWLQALLAVVCSGKGSGGILFKTFEQELVNARASETGGIATHVETIDLEGKSIRTIADGHTFLVEQAESGTRETLLFRKAPSGEPLLAAMRS